MGGWYAPEVCRKQRKTKAVDIFSAGCVIYYALTKGKHPFNGSAFDVVDENSNFEVRDMCMLHRSMNEYVMNNQTNDAVFKNLYLCVHYIIITSFFFSSSSLPLPTI
jgi:serine/threonine protein kinase